MTRRVSRPNLYLCLLAAGVVASAVLASSTARAADARETAAARQFYAGKYEEALASYVDLAVTTRNPAYMCEIGRCHYRLGRTDEATKNLRDCLAQAKLDARKRREFRALLTELERAPAAGAPPAGAPPARAPPAALPPPAPPFLSPTGQAAPPPPPPPPAYLGPAQGSAPAPAPPPGYPPPPATADAAPMPPGGYPPPGASPGQAGPPPGWGYPQQPGPPPPGQPGQPLAPAIDVNASAASGGSSKTGAYVVGAVGVAGLLAGGGFTFLANKTFNEVEREYSADKEKTGKRYNLLQFVGYGVGAAGLATAVILLARTGGSPEPAARLSLELHPTGIGLRGRF